MLFGNREPRSLVARRRGAFRPVDGVLVALEPRVLMSIDLGGQPPPALPNIASVPFGVLNAGAVGGSGAGFNTVQIGDVNGDGFGDLLIGAPALRQPGTLIGPIAPGGNGTPTAYLEYGSLSAAGGNTNWTALDTAGQRVSDLSQLGSLTQSNPITITGQTNFPYEGIKFVASQQGGANQLGTGLSGGAIINGSPTVLLGAPGALDLNGANPGTGRAYLVYTNDLTTGNLPTKQLDLDNPPTGVRVITFVNNSSGANTATGYAVDEAFNLLGDFQYDVVISAPGASFGGQSNNGAVYVIPASAIPNVSTTINLATVGQVGGVAGFVFTGTGTNSLFGWSLANVPSFTGIDSLLIGSPLANSGAGAVYDVFSQTTLATAVVTNTTTNSTQNFIPASQIGNATKDGLVNPAQGAQFLGANAGDLTGYSIATAANFDLNNSLGDILIGSPGFGSDAGAATLVYTNSQFNVLSGGIYQLQSNQAVPFPREVNTGDILPSATFFGPTANSFAGYSVSFAGKDQTVDKTNDVVIGAPGFNNNTGQTFLIPGTQNITTSTTTTTAGYFGLVGTFGLSTAETQPVGGLQINLTDASVSTVGTFLGGSLSGARQLFPVNTLTYDANPASFSIGAPGYAAKSGQSFAGGVFNVEDSFITGLRQPNEGNVFVSGGTSITKVSGNSVTITVVANANGINNAGSTANSGGPLPFSPGQLNGVGGNPDTGIDTTRLMINGFLVPPGDVSAVTSTQNGLLFNASFTIPATDLHLATGTAPSLGTADLGSIGGFTVSNYAGSLTNSNDFWVGVGISGGGSSSNGGSTITTGALGSATAIGKIVPTFFLAPFGPDTAVPTISALSELSSYQPIPLKVALAQFKMPAGFAQRLIQYYHPTKVVKRPLTGQAAIGFHHKTEISHAAVVRSTYKKAAAKTFTHKELVVPSNLQTESLGATKAVKAKTNKHKK